jgi:DhnA family fructose-bisphosphate aldolase class Ia
MKGKDLRLSRLFPQGRNAVIVAIDHGQTFGPVAEPQLISRARQGSSERPTGSCWHRR